MRKLMLCAALSLAWMAPAAAQTDAELRARCGTRGSDDENIAGCTAAIESNVGPIAFKALAYRIRGGHYERKGELDRALQDYNRALLLQPGEYDAIMERGDLYARLGDHERAIFDYSTALGLQPRNPRAIIGRGRVFALKGELERAIEEYNAAITIEPKSVQPFASRAEALARLGRFAQALEDCNRVIEINPTSAYHYELRGHVHLMAGRLDPAINDYNRALLDRLHPSASAYYGRGLARQRKGDAAGGAKDMADGRALEADVAEQLERRGVK